MGISLRVFILGSVFIASVAQAGLLSCPIPLFDQLRVPLQRMPQAVLGGAFLCDHVSVPALEEHFQHSCALVQQDMQNALALTKHTDGVAAGMVFQEIARNSHQQATCRASLFGVYRSDRGRHQSLNSQVEASFNAILPDLGPLARHLQDLRKVEREDQLQSADRAMAGLLRQGLEETRKQIQETESELTKRLLSIPMGYDPDVAQALTAMAVSGAFNTKSFEASMVRAEAKYQNAKSYYAEKLIASRQNRNDYCLGLDYRNMVGRSGQLGTYLKGLPEKTQDEKNFKKSLSCQMHATYEVGQERLDNGLAVAGFALMFFPPAGEAEAVASVGAKVAGTAVKTLEGASAAATLMGLDTLRQQCYPSGALVSSSAACDPKKEFDHMVVESNLSACAIGAVMTAASIAKLSKWLQALFKNRKLTPEPSVPRAPARSQAPQTSAVRTRLAEEANPVPASSLPRSVKVPKDGMPQFKLAQRGRFGGRVFPMEKEPKASWRYYDIGHGPVVIRDIRAQNYNVLGEKLTDALGMRMSENRLLLPDADEANGAIKALNSRLRAQDKIGGRFYRPKDAQVSTEEFVDRFGQDRGRPLSEDVAEGTHDRGYHFAMVLPERIENLAQMQSRALSEFKKFLESTRPQLAEHQDVQKLMNEAYMKQGDELDNLTAYPYKLTRLKGPSLDANIAARVHEGESPLEVIRNRFDFRTHPELAKVVQDFSRLHANDPQMTTGLSRAEMTDLGVEMIGRISRMRRAVGDFTPWRSAYDR